MCVARFSFFKLELRLPEWNSNTVRMCQFGQCPNFICDIFRK